MIGSKKTSEAGRVLDNPKILIEENIYFSISEQCRWYGVSRGQYYHKAEVKKDRFEELRNSLRKKYIFDPSSGSRRITGALNREGWNVQRGLVRRIMRETNLKGLTPKRKVNYPKNPAHKLLYLLRDLKVRPNQVWSTDITYIKTERCHMYLTAIIDVESKDCILGII